MKNYNFIVTALFFFSQSMNLSAAPCSKKTEQINKILALSFNDTILKKNFEPNFDQVRSQTKIMLDQIDFSHLPKSQRKILTSKFKQIDKITEDLVNTLQRDLSFANLQGVLFSFFDEEFTDEEIQALLNFYETEVGKKLANKSFKISEKLAGLVKEAMNKHIPSYQQLISDTIFNK